MPMVSEFVSAIKSQSTPLLSRQSNAEIQVDIVLKKLRCYGRDAHVDFKDPITFALMTTRWRYNSWAGEVMEHDLKWWRKEFIEAYQAYRERDDAQGMLLPHVKTPAIAGFKEIALRCTR